MTRRKLETLSPWREKKSHVFHISRHRYLRSTRLTLPRPIFFKLDIYPVWNEIRRYNHRLSIFLPFSWSPQTRCSRFEIIFSIRQIAIVVSYFWLNETNTLLVIRIQETKHKNVARTSINRYTYYVSITQLRVRRSILSCRRRTTLPTSLIRRIIKIITPASTTLQRYV